MGDDGKLIYGPEGNGEPDGIFKFSSNEIAGETGAQGKLCLLYTSLFSQ